MTKHFWFLKHIDLIRGVCTIHSKIKESGFQSDYIVAIVRGGLIPAVHLSHDLGIRMEALQWSKRDHCIQEHNCWIPDDLVAGKKILIVEDIVDSGDTIREVLADWRQSNSKLTEQMISDQVRIAALVYNESQPIKVDYCYKRIDRSIDDTWIVFPWENHVNGT